MTTLVKTSVGGFNIDQVTNWNRDYDDQLVLWLACAGVEGQSYIKLKGHDADRAVEILESVALFDTTSPRQKG